MTVYRVYVSRETLFVKQQTLKLLQLFHVKQLRTFELYVRLILARKEYTARQTALRPT